MVGSEDSTHPSICDFLLLVSRFLFLFFCSRWNVGKNEKSHALGPGLDVGGRRHRLDSTTRTNPDQIARPRFAYTHQISRHPCQGNVFLSFPPGPFALNYPP